MASLRLAIVNAHTDLTLIFYQLNLNSKKTLGVNKAKSIQSLVVVKGSRPLSAKAIKENIGFSFSTVSRFNLVF